MTDPNLTEINEEEVVDTGEETPAGSSPDNETTEETHSPEGEHEENTQEDSADDRPLNEHPRWKEREKEWTKRFNEQEQRNADQIRALREEFGLTRKTNEVPEMPSWFGGNQEQWEAYCKDRERDIQAAEERALKRISANRQEESKAVKDATDFLRSEIAEIQSSKTLNPTNIKIDAARLFKIVQDNDLIDSKGRWNYRAGWKIYRTETQTAIKTNVDAKKRAAGATRSAPAGDPKPSDVATPDSLKKNKPW